MTGTVITIADRRPLPAAPKVGRKVAAKRTRIDEDWQPSKAEALVCDKYGMPQNIRRFQWEKFIAYHAGKGSKMAKWPQAWRTWVMNWAERSGGRGFNSAQGPRATGFSAIAGLFDDE